jgi:hypothetical protein
MSQPKSPIVFAILTSQDRDRVEVVLPRSIPRKAYEALQREVSRAAWRIVGRRRKASRKAK